MNYDTVTLDEVSEKIDYGLTTSATSSDTGVKFLRITDIQENGVDWQSVPFCECDEKDFKQYSLARGDIVFARTGATTGKSFLIKDTPDKTVFASYLIRVRANQKLVDPEFLSYFFQTPQYWRQISDSAVGAAQVGVNGSKLAELKIPLPPLTEQKRIASLLARADRLRHLRRTAHDLGESLLQSVFLEMFGDITRNEKGWEAQKLEDLCDEITVGYVGPMASEYTQSGVLFLRSQNIKPFRIDLNDVKYVSPKFHKKLKKSAISPGNVVVVRTGLAGTAAVVPDNFPETNCSDLVIIRPSSKINNQYLAMLFNSSWGKGHVEGNAVGQIQQHFNIGSANEMKVPLPPLSLQEEFAGVVRRVESLRGRMGESARQVEGLFESLLAEAFT